MNSGDITPGCVFLIYTSNGLQFLLILPKYVSKVTTSMRLSLISPDALTSRSQTTLPSPLKLFHFNATYYVKINHICIY